LLKIDKIPVNGPPKDRHSSDEQVQKAFTLFSKPKLTFCTNSEDLSISGKRGCKLRAIFDSLWQSPQETILP
jgi:hypothetical protein